MKAPEIRTVSFDLIDADPENPNVEDVQTFNELVDTIREYGWLQPALVVTNGDRYRTVAGEHRVKAGRLAGMSEGAVVIGDHLTRDQQRLLLSRMNVLTGRLDPAKFTALWTELGKRFEPDELRRKMGFSGRDTELRRLVRDTAKTLPEKMRDDLLKRADRIRSVEDLAAAVNQIFAQHGGTLDQHFVVFSFGGQAHAMIRCTAQTFAPIKRLLEESVDRFGKPIDEVLAEAAGRLLEEPSDGKGKATDAA